MTYLCPICKNKDILEYEQFIACPLCFKRFDKSDLENYKDVDKIRSMEEKYKK